jgi:hypothetical protein
MKLVFGKKQPGHYNRDSVSKKIPKKTFAFAQPD